MPVALSVPLLAESPGATTATVGRFLLAGFVVFAAAILLSLRQRWRDLRQGDVRAETRAFIVYLLAAGLAARLTVAALLRLQELNEVIAPDEATFDGNARMFSAWLAGDSPYRLSARYLSSLQVGYFYFVGFLYHVFGPVPFLAVLLNCVFGTLAALPVHRIAESLGGRAAARPAAVLATFFPSVLLWSTLLIRDSLVILVIVCLIDAQMRLAERFSTRRLVWLGVLLALLGTLRQYLFVVLIAALVAAFLIGRKGRAGRSLLTAMAALLLIIVLTRFVGFGAAEMERASLEEVNLQRRYNSSVESARGSFLPQVDISTPARAVAYLPVGIVYFFFSPFPWQILSRNQMLGLPDVLLFYALLPAIFRGLVWVVRHRLRQALMLLLTVVAIALLYALVEGNVGIIFRHRAQVLVPLMVVAGIGIAAKRAARSATAPAAVPDQFPRGSPA